MYSGPFTVSGLAAELEERKKKRARLDAKSKLSFQEDEEEEEEDGEAADAPGDAQASLPEWIYDQAIAALPLVRHMKEGPADVILLCITGGIPGLEGSTAGIRAAEEP